MNTFGAADDGRLFFGEGVCSSSSYQAWQEARLLALPPAVATAPLVRRPYDLRHSALSTWPNAGVDPTAVADAKCIDGRQEVANRRIEDLLRAYE